jgi:alpha-farnesene synthase
MHLTSTSQIPKAETCSEIDQSVQRRTANYKPNIWKYDLLQSLTSKFSEEQYSRKAERLKEDVTRMYVCTNDLISKLELIDSISNLGLSNYFEEEIKEELDAIGFPENSRSNTKRDLYATSLWFRLLRQYGYNPPQDIFLEYLDKNGKFMSSSDSNAKGMLELFQASNLSTEGENILKEARSFSVKHLRRVSVNSSNKFGKQIDHALSLPLHWKGEWYDIRKYIHDHDTENKTNSVLVELAKLNFNIVQAAHQEDLKDLSRWWISLGITEKMSFVRDRLAESFLYAVGIAFEPQYGSLRKWLSKVITLILIVDDVYDIYGSLEELECFSNAVERWKPEEINELPECMKTCFWALYNTTKEIAAEIQKEKGLTSVLPYLQKAWADFCNSLLVEAKWYNEGYTPSLKEYLDNGWMSSSGPLLALHVILGIANQTTKDISEFLKDNRDLVYCTSLIIRLCNDQGTSAAELERGDASSSILCYMREANVSEEVAREHVRNIIVETWEKINSHCMSATGTFPQEPVIKHIVNTGRAAHFTYQNGDGFGVQDLETREQILSSLIEPLAL